MWESTLLRVMFFVTIVDFFHGCFASPLRFGFAFEAELWASIYAISYAWTNEWYSLWLESGPSFVVHLLQSRKNGFPGTL